MAKMSRRTLVVIMLVAVAVATVAGVVWWLGGDEPAVVDAERALSDDAAGSVPAENDEEPPRSEDPPVGPEELAGSWVVDTSRPFDRAAGRGTFVGYRIEEELVGVGATTAVGRTPAVTGHLVFDRTQLTEARIDADLSVLVSDDERRDRRVAAMLGPDAHASFVLVDTIDLGEVPSIAEVIEVEIRGQLTIGDTTRPVTVVIEAALTQAGMVVAGSTRIRLSEFSVTVPSASIVLSASDEAVLEWQLYLRRQ